jgi:hypothetical protein
MATTPNRLPPHPLVIGAAAARMQDMNAFAASDLAGAAASRPVPEAAKRERPTGGETASEGDGGAAIEDFIEDQVDKFSAERGRQPYQLVAGYLGGCRQDMDRPPAQVLFLDSKLAKWLLVQLDEIVLFNRVNSDSAAFGVLDVLWLKPDARVVAGDESDVVAQSYLTGPFVRADQLGATVSGGTYPRQGGLLMEAVTPGCCGKTRR